MSVNHLQDDPGYLEQHEVKVLLLEQVLVLAAELLAAAPGIGLGFVGVRALSEVPELCLECRQCPFGRLRLGLHQDEAENEVTRIRMTNVSDMWACSGGDVRTLMRKPM